MPPVLAVGCFFLAAACAGTLGFQPADSLIRQAGCLADGTGWKPIFRSRGFGASAATQLTVKKSHPIGSEALRRLLRWVPMKTFILCFCALVAVALFASPEKCASHPEYEFLIGPSVNVHPTRWSFVTVAPLVGATSDSPDVEVFVVAGFKMPFGGRPVRDEQEAAPPASMFGR
jgi:hypothetical protein